MNSIIYIFPFYFQRVLVIVHHDLDAICSMKILQSLFKCDSRVYALEPVAGVQDFKLAYERYRHEVSIT